MNILLVGPLCLTPFRRPSNLTDGDTNTILASVVYWLSLIIMLTIWLLLCIPRECNHMFFRISILLIIITYFNLHVEHGMDFSQSQHGDDVSCAIIR